MVVVASHMELVALELGMQSVARHGLQVQLDSANETVIDAKARIAELEKALGLEPGEPVKAPAKSPNVYVNEG